jgi:hypothetical protein
MARVRVGAGAGYILENIETEFNVQVLPYIEYT